MESAVGCATASAVQAVNRAVIQLFWDIGRSIVQREEFESWEAGWVDSISRDLQSTYPGSTAFSAQNIQRMRRFFLAYTRDYGETAEGHEMDGINLPEVLTALPWRHNVLLVEIVQDPAERLWYAQTAVEFGWGRETLEHEIRQGRYRQSGKVTCSSPDSVTGSGPRDPGGSAYCGIFATEFSVVAWSGTLFVPSVDPISGWDG